MGSPARPLCGPVGELFGPPRRAIYRTCAQRYRTEKLPEKSQHGLYKGLAATQSRVTWSNPRSLTAWQYSFSQDTSYESGELPLAEQSARRYGRSVEGGTVLSHNSLSLCISMGSVANHRKQESWDSQVIDFLIANFWIWPPKANFATEPRFRGGHHQVVPLQRHILRSSHQHIRPAAPVVGPPAANGQFVAVRHSSLLSHWLGPIAEGLVQQGGCLF